MRRAPPTRRVDGVAPQEGVEGGETLAPALAGVALADRPGEEDQGRERDVEEEEGDGGLGERRLKRVGTAEAEAEGLRSRHEDLEGEEQEELPAEEPGSRPDADLARVVLPQEDAEEDEEKREDDDEADERRDDAAAQLVPESPSVAVLLVELPPRQAVADEVDVQEERDRPGRTGVRDAVAEDVVDAVLQDVRAGAVVRERRGAREGARGDEAVCGGPHFVLGRPAPLLLGPGAGAGAEDDAVLPDEDVAVLGVLLETLSEVGDAVGPEARPDDRVLLQREVRGRVARDLLLDEEALVPGLDAEGLVERNAEAAGLGVGDFHRRGPRQGEAARLRRLEPRQQGQKGGGPEDAEGQGARRLHALLSTDGERRRFAGRAAMRADRTLREVTSSS